MSDGSATEILNSLMSNLKEILTTKTIVGDPVQVGKTTILPVMRVSLGFGAGAGTAAAGKQGGGGGGGGIAITPVGFLIVEEGRAMMVTPKSSRWDWVVESIPDLFEKILAARREHEKKKDSAKESSSSTETPAV